MKTPPALTLSQVEAELFQLRQEVASRYADATRVIEWIDNPDRKMAVLAFTEGNERQIAYRFEMLLAAQTKLKAGWQPIASAPRDGSQFLWLPNPSAKVWISAWFSENRNAFFETAHGYPLTESDACLWHSAPDLP